MRPGNIHWTMYRSAIALFCDPSIVTDIHGNLPISFRQVQTCKMSKYIASWHPLLFLLSTYLNALRRGCISNWIHQACSPSRHKSHNRPRARMKYKTCSYVHKVARTQKTLEETCTALHQKTILSNAISTQDRRELHTACCCLNSLRIRVEALANVTKQSVRKRQLCLIQNRKQFRSPENLHAENNSSLTSGTPHRFGPSTSSGQS